MKLLHVNSVKSDSKDIYNVTSYIQQVTSNVQVFHFK